VQPGVEEPGGVQPSLDPGRVGVGDAVGEADQLPQRCAGPAVAGRRPGGRRRRGVFGFGGDAVALGQHGGAVGVERGQSGRQGGDGVAPSDHRGGDRVGVHLT
jgi:hypothetical protein